MKNPTRKAITFAEFAKSENCNKVYDLLVKKRDDLGKLPSSDKGWEYCLINEVVACLEPIMNGDFYPRQTIEDVDAGILSADPNEIVECIESELRGDCAGNLLGSETDAYWLAFNYCFDDYREDENLNRLFD